MKYPGSKRTWENDRVIKAKNKSSVSDILFIKKITIYYLLKSERNVDKTVIKLITDSKNERT